MARALRSSSLTARGFLVADELEGFLDLQLAALLLALAHVGEEVLQLVGHLLHAGRGHDLHPGRALGDLDVDLLVVQLAFAQALAEQLTGVGIAALHRLFGKAYRARWWQQGVEDAFFGGVFGAVAHLVHLLLAQHLQRRVGQIADDRFDVTADIADLGELGSFHFQERRVGQLGQAAGNFGLADAGGADHQNVLRGDFTAQLGGQLHAPPAVAQGDGHGALGVVLADDVAVEFVDDLAGRHGHGAVLRNDRRLDRAVELLDGQVLIGEHADAAGDVQRRLGDFGPTCRRRP